MQKSLLILVISFALASLIHFIHNAEFLGDYPGLPDSWSRAGVYLAWGGMTVVGGVGCVLLFRGHKIAGLLIVAVYALLGIDSLGHYVVAPVSSHTWAMNVTILLEVTAAVLLFVECIRLLLKRRSSPPTSAPAA